VQETFLRAWAQIGTYDGARGGFREWIFRIARNLDIDAWRRDKKRAHLHVTLGENEHVVDPKEGPSARAMVKEQLLQLQRCLHELSEDERSLIRMRSLEGLPYGHIRAQLFSGRRTEKALRSLYRRALIKLKDCMDDPTT
jgi:RNA polymerase sigma-70 factor (ECF subfamily)